MGWLENLAGGFVVLVLASLIFLVIGFLLNSTGRHADQEEAPLTPRGNAFIALGYLVMLGFWSYWLADDWPGTSDIFMMSIAAIWIVVALVNIFRHARAALPSRRS